MKLIIARNELLKAVQNVIGAVEGRQTLPILANILLVAQEGKLYTTATDLEFELKSHANTEEIIEPGEITVSARKLVDICRSLPNDLMMSLETNAHQLTVKSGKRIFNLATLPAKEFPNVDQITNEQVLFVLPQRKLKKMFSRTAFAIPQQDVRYFLNGMLFELSKNNLNLVATDGHRLALAGVSIPSLQSKCDSFQAIVPRKAVLELSHLLKDSDDEMKITFGTNHIMVSTEDFTMTSKLIDGKYPNYNRVIPKNCSKKVISDLANFKVSLNCVSILANEAFRGVRFSLSENTLRMFANNTEQEEADEQLEVNYKGPDLEIAFNVDYLIDICNTISADEINVSLSDPTTPILIEETNDEYKYTYVVMPMRL